MMKSLLTGFATYLMFVTTIAQDVAGFSSNEDSNRTIWKGFARHDFQYEEREIRLIIPKKALPGNPWIWRARFPDWHTETDSILVSEGFHLVYINTDNLYGSPKSMNAWDELYQYMTTQYQLNAKVALIGVSRGGLFVYNWAKKNPKKVACIYAEAPVCDFKSWPMGRSDDDWNRLKKAYGFSTDKEAIAYTNNPMDNLGMLAENEIPVLHMIGLEDRVVPPEENTFVLVNKYLRLGGTATVVPCTKGTQSLEGHHFEIETPRYVADFIKYHAVTEIPLDASAYHSLGGGLTNSRIQFERSRKGRIAFLGGSITYNGGWRDSLMIYFQNRFPDTKFEFISAGIPSMGSTPSAFRLERDVLSHGQVDLLFVEAAVNDQTNGRTSTEQIRAMEGIIRKFRKSNPTGDIVMMHFVDPEKMETYRDGGVPKVIENHNMVAKHYQIPVINLAKEVTDRIDNHEFSWENDFVDLHPSPFGQGIYVNSIIQFLDDAYSGQSKGANKLVPSLPDKLDQQCYDNGKLVDISTSEESKGWELIPSWTPVDNTGVRENYVNVPMLVGQTPGNIITASFIGNTVGVAVAAGQDAGIIEYRVDKQPWQQLNLFTRWSTQLHLPWYYTLASGLSNQDHTLEIRVSEKKDERSSGQACRIRYFYVNQF